MTMPQSAAKVKGEPDILALPDITDSEKAAMTSFKHLAFTGIVRDLFLHFGEPADAHSWGKGTWRSTPESIPRDAAFPTCLLPSMPMSPSCIARTAM